VVPVLHDDEAASPLGPSYPAGSSDGVCSTHGRTSGRTHGAADAFERSAAGSLRSKDRAQQATWTVRHALHWLRNGARLMIADRPTRRPNIRFSRHKQRKPWLADLEQHSGCPRQPEAARVYSLTTGGVGASAKLKWRRASLNTVPRKIDHRRGGRRLQSECAATPNRCQPWRIAPLSADNSPRAARKTSLRPSLSDSPNSRSTRLKKARRSDYLSDPRRRVWRRTAQVQQLSRSPARPPPISSRTNRTDAAKA